MAPQHAIRAVFMRGGTSKALIFHAYDLPDAQAARDQIFLAALGSPDPNGRQLNGMGGGLSSLSKVCIVGPPTHPEADVDYTFAQIAITAQSVDYSGNCGNMSSAIGPFAVDEGLVTRGDGEAVVRIHNTNTRKILAAHFEVSGGRARIDGDFELPGVGRGAPIRLDFLNPAGAATGRLLPTGNAIDQLVTADSLEIASSMVDASNPCVFIAASALGLSGTEMPDELEQRPALLDQLEALRVGAGLRMGIAQTAHEAAAKPSIPKIAMLSAPQDSRTLAGENVSADSVDIVARMMSQGQPHRAIPLTGAMCLAVAARLDGSLAHQLSRRPRRPADPVRIAQPSGVTVVDASVRRENDAYVVDHVSVYRTARRLMDGRVYIPASALTASAVQR